LLPEIATTTAPRPPAGPTEPVMALKSKTLTTANHSDRDHREHDE